EEEELLLHLPAPLFPPFWLRGHRPSTGSVAGPAAMGASGAKEAPAALATPIVQPKNLRAKPADHLADCGCARPGPRISVWALVAWPGRRRHRSWARSEDR
ncbi:unnamed protein product, partial [Prorocentrum cordatum]